MALRPAGVARPLRQDREPACHVRTEGQGSVWPRGRGLQRRGRGPQRLDGLAGLGDSLSQLLEGLRGPGGRRIGGEARGVARGVRAALGLAARQAVEQCRRGASREAHRGVPDQGEYRQGRRADLSRARGDILRPDTDRYSEGRALVLQRGQGAFGRVAKI